MQAPIVKFARKSMTVNSCKSPSKILLKIVPIKKQTIRNRNVRKVFIFYEITAIRNKYIKLKVIVILFYVIV